MYEMTGKIKLKKGTTPARERVLIAKDIIKQLQAERLVGMSGIYVRELKGKRGKEINYENELRATTENMDAQKLVRNVRCGVCAKGAIVIGMVDRFDQLKFSPGSIVTDHLESIARSGDRAYVTQLFHPSMLNRMEDAFEDDWKSAYGDDTDRLDAIMRNIIAGKGEFDIKAVPPPRRQPISKLATVTAANGGPGK